ncbi:YwhD family protein [Salipaludibacillus agaradhaerens]|uniref:YwhD family protein n=1 Tax=Salipaludibacillus agaradhaerens TaxID=76935 RepID=UPI0021509158|nr:YwhD family protein [Salipaludibacillus agaradhaerens]MCR6108270.1 YwhD family protein [Salipaludibacillus agaradhaerens]MCR6120295.1 YwhD family protein [Salipaludibacillus agaradhaerens]
MNEADKEKNEKIKKMSKSFNILSNDSTDGHGGFGVGTLNLNNITPVFVDVKAGEAFVDMGALHARSVVEKGIKFLKDKEEVPNGRPYWLVWVTVEPVNGGPAYVGVTGCEMTVDRDIRRGYKSLPEHVNNMDKSLKRKIIVSHMDDTSKAILKRFLIDFDAGMWERADAQLKEDLSIT